MNAMSAVRLTKRNGWFYAVIKRPHGQGRAIRHWLRTKSETEAWQRVKEQKLEELAKVDAADAFTRDVWTRMIAGRRVTVRDSLAAFKEHRVVIGKPMRDVIEEQTLLDQFVRFVSEHEGSPDFGNAQIAQVETKHIAAWVNAEDGTKLSYRRKRLGKLAVWLEWNVSQRWLVRNPTVDVAVRLDGLSQEQLISRPHAAFTEDEVKKLLEATPRADFWHGAILLAYHFGLRLGAICTLENTNIVGHDLRLFTTKGQRMVHERMPDDVLAWLEEWKAVRPASDLPYLFPAQAAQYLGNGSTMSKQFRALADKAGFLTLSFHGLRKTATQKKWSAELDSLPPDDKRQLMRLVAEKGFRRVQELLAHAPGSSVTETNYMQRAPAACGQPP